MCGPLTPFCACVQLASFKDAFKLLAKACSDEMDELWADVQQTWVFHAVRRAAVYTRAALTPPVVAL